MRNTKTTVITVAIGAFEAESLLTECLALIGIMIKKADCMQQTARISSPFEKSSACSSLVTDGRSIQMLNRAVINKNSNNNICNNNSKNNNSIWSPGPYTWQRYS